jgi:uncharacterized phage protein (TIGR02218 family)
MKSVIADYRFRCHGVRIECTNGLIVRLTDYPRDLSMGGNSYLSDNGYQFTGQQSGTGMAAGVMDLEGIATITGISRDQIASGVFDSARLYLFATSWKTPVEDEEPMGAAILGRTTLEDDRYRIEMMQLVDALSQSVGRSHGAACDKVFGGQTYAGCKVDLVPLTVTGTITHVTDGAHFRDSARSEAADWFGLGTVRFTTGDNVGLKPLEIKEYAANGSIETYEPAYYPVQVGDEYEMIPGCRKRWQEDCVTKYDNVLNFGGFPRIPTTSQYQQVGTK